MTDGFEGSVKFVFAALMHRRFPSLVRGGEHPSQASIILSTDHPLDEWNTAAGFELARQQKDADIIKMMRLEMLHAFGDEAVGAGACVMHR